MKYISILVLFLTSSVAMFINMTAAQAHDQVVKTNPNANQTLDKAPDKIEMELSAQPQNAGNRISVKDEKGTEYAQGAIEIKNHTAVQKLKDKMPHENYTVQWRLVSSDGHPIDGSFKFKVEDPSSSPSQSHYSSGAVSNAQNTSEDAATDNSEVAQDSQVGGTVNDSAKEIGDNTLSIVSILIGFFILLLGLGILLYALSRRRKNNAKTSQTTVQEKKTSEEKADAAKDNSDSKTTSGKEPKLDKNKVEKSSVTSDSDRSTTELNETVSNKHNTPGGQAAQTSQKLQGQKNSDKLGAGADDLDSTKDSEDEALPASVASQPSSKKVDDSASSDDITEDSKKDAVSDKEEVLPKHRDSFQHSNELDNNSQSEDFKDSSTTKIDDKSQEQNLGSSSSSKTAGAVVAGASAVSQTSTTAEEKSDLEESSQKYSENQEQTKNTTNHDTESNFDAETKSSSTTAGSSKANNSDTNSVEEKTLSRQSESIIHDLDSYIDNPGETSIIIDEKEYIVDGVDFVVDDIRSDSQDS